jgi:hypothetical protein
VIADTIRQLAAEELTAHDQPLISMAIGAMTSAIDSIIGGSHIDLSELEAILNDLLPGGELREPLLTNVARLPYSPGEAEVSALQIAMKALRDIEEWGCPPDSERASQAHGLMQERMAER